MDKTTRGMVRRQIDQRLKPLKPLASKTAVLTKSGWIKTIRRALGMTAKDMAQRMALTEARIYALENGELEGATTLKSLRRAAEAMNCELVYAFIPKISLEQMVEQQALKLARSQVGRVDRTMRIEEQGTSNAVIEAKVKELADDYRRNPPRKLWRAV